MGKRGRQRQPAADHGGVAPLKGQNVNVGGRRTSMRLEPSMWDALEEIARREQLSVNDLCSRIEDRRCEQCRRRGVDPEQSEVTLTSAVRVFIASYFRNACTDTGHVQAGHGVGDPFVGTPLDLPTGSDGSDPASGGGGSGPADSGGGGYKAIDAQNTVAVDARSGVVSG